MSCEQARLQWLSAVYDGRDPSTAACNTHIHGCAACRQFVAQSQALDTVLAQDSDAEPRPGFDTRFFAHLRSQKQKRATRRLPAWVWALAGAAACTLAGIVWWKQPAPQPTTPAELALAIELDMYREDVQMLVNLQDVEAFALLEQLPPDALREGHTP